MVLSRLLVSGVAVGTELIIPPPPGGTLPGTSNSGCALPPNGDPRRRYGDPVRSVIDKELFKAVGEAGLGASLWHPTGANARSVQTPSVHINRPVANGIRGSFSGEECRASRTRLFGQYRSLPALATLHRRSRKGSSQRVKVRALTVAIRPLRLYAGGRSNKGNLPEIVLMGSRYDVTALLGQWSHGNPDALNRLLPLIYAELRRVASRQLRRERGDHTLQPTALVHEVYLRLADQRQVDCRNRAHFFGVAAQVMRRILVDHARRHGAAKRGEGVQRVSIDEVKEDPSVTQVPVLALDFALVRLKKVDPGLAFIVELRAFAGLTIEEAAHVLEVSPSTIKREWRTARAWLTRELGSGIR